MKVEEINVNFSKNLLSGILSFKTLSIKKILDRKILRFPKQKYETSNK